MITQQQKAEQSNQFSDCLKAGMTVPALCVLCREVPPAVCSHVIPRLVSRHIGDLLGSQKLRGTENINRAVQDTAKFPLLCRPCEEKFGSLERAFMIDHFSPYFENSYSESYGQEFYKLLLSVAFRTLSYIAVGPEQTKITERMSHLIETWRLYLHEDKSLDYTDLYAIRHHELELIPGWDVKNKVWMGQGVYASHPHAEEARYFAHAQMGPFHVFADLDEIVEKGAPIEVSWAPLKITQNGGSFSKIIQVPQELRYMLSQSALLYSNKVKELSDAQYEKILIEQEKHSRRLQELRLK